MIQLIGPGGAGKTTTGGALAKRPPEREEHVIRMRFHFYAGLPARKVETMRPNDAVVDDLCAILSRG